MSWRKELSKRTIDRLTEYLERGKALDENEPPFDTPAWESWNAESVALTDEYHDDIVQAIRYFLRYIETGKSDEQDAHQVAIIIKTVIDADKALLPVIAAYKLENLDFPLDKVNNRVWQLLEEADGQTWNIDVAKTGSKKTIDILYCLDIEDMDDVSITRKLEPYDKRLYIAVDAICHIGYFNMSYQQLYNAMGYEGRAGKADIEKMDASLTKMSSARLYIDNTQEAKAYKYDKFIYDGALLPMERIKGVINGQVADAAIHVFRVPPLMAFARERKQITTINRRLLGSPLNKTSQNLCIEDYLIYRIARIKNGTSKNKILLSTIYENAGITTIKQKQRAPAKIKQLLDHYVKCGFIKGYSPEELDDLKKNDGVTIRY